MKFTDQEIEFIKTYAPTKGIVYCSKELNRHYQSVRQAASRNHIPIKKASKRSRWIHNNDPFHLASLLTPEAVYTAGFIWGDGHISKTSCVTSITIKEEDGIEMTPIFNVANEWNITKVPRHKETWSDMISFRNYFESGYDQLSSMNYLNKTGEVPDLSKVPFNLLHYWYLGYSDADGCFYNNEKQSLAQYQITSCINQDWSNVETLLTSLDINYQIDRREVIDKDGGLHARSNIRFQGVPNVTKWGTYIYQTYGQDGIGLRRKHSSYVECFRMGRLFS